ncbi:MAG: efflux RND transporter periplasmic adaptor subunit [Bacteroidales bacterium]|nr:efflux RND transporter periplasmic adaptor subunit [Bacteroidales bacterium]
MKKNKKWIRIGVILLVILVVALAIARKKGLIGESSGIKVSTEKVEKRDIIETVTASGKIQPEKEVKLSPDVSGEVIALNVKEGDEIKKGQTLAKINPEIYRSNYERSVATLNTQKANLANAKARFAQAKAQFINAKAEYERKQKLWEQKAISESEFDAAKSSFAVAKADVEAARENVNAAGFQVKSAEAAVSESKENLTKTNIIAPTDGTISKLNIEQGERVAGASQFSSGTEIMRIADLGNMEVHVEVSENDIVRVSYTDTALIEVDAYLNRKFKGLVTEIATSANVSGVSADQVTNFDVKIRILRASYKDLIPEDHPNMSPFRPGMSASVDIQTEDVRGVVSVPIQAVTTREDTTGTNKNEEKAGPGLEDMQEYVFVNEQGKAKLTRVKTGIQDSRYIEIEEGLELDDEVVVAPYRVVTKTLKDGDMIEPVPRKKLFSEE